MLEVTGEDTGIRGDQEGIVSKRMQDHLWITADGTMHLLANVGERKEGGLYVYSLGHDGVWTPTLHLPDSYRYSNGDAVGGPQSVDIAYGSTAEDILWVHAEWSSEPATWTITGHSAVWRHSTRRGIDPTLAVTADGDFLVSFTQTRGHASSIEVRGSYDHGASFVDLRADFAPRAETLERAASVVAVGDGAGVVYTDDGRLGWAWLEDGEWRRERLLTRSEGQNDPRGTHFSVASTGDGAIHVATNDGDHGLVYLYRDPGTERWSQQSFAVEGATYMQVSVSAEGDVYLLCDQARSILVLAGEGGDAPFEQIAALPPSDKARGNPRMESPATFSGDVLPVLRQSGNAGDTLQRLDYYAVPLGTWG
ncbi:MAG: hypothetical protein HQL41_06190 [Alphaproteobacteria bacterium]|nr:hypothetical protein [Alphaproteobacteria bacterium]